MGDLAERLHALAEMNSRPLPERSSTLYRDLTLAQAKDYYLALVADGNMPDEAARTIGMTGRFCRGWRSHKSTRYDSAFAERYEEIMAPQGEHREALVQKARGALAKAAEEGNVRAIEKILMAYDPDFSFMRQAQHVGSLNVENMLVLMKDVPTPILQQVRQALESKREDIDAA